MRSRIREVRKAKGLTLAEVAMRIRPEPTTAQTIGRLETGMRTLSVDWLNRIAGALDVDPSELITLPDHIDCPLIGVLGKDGQIQRAPSEMVTLSLTVKDPVAIRVQTFSGEYRVGDLIICEHIAGDSLHLVNGHDCIIEDRAGLKLFGRLHIAKNGTVTLSTLSPKPQLYSELDILWAARAVILTRQLT